MGDDFLPIVFLGDFRAVIVFLGGEDFTAAFLFVALAFVTVLAFAGALGFFSFKAFPFGAAGFLAAGALPLAAAGAFPLAAAGFLIAGAFALASVALRFCPAAEGDETAVSSVFSTFLAAAAAAVFFGAAAFFVAFLGDAFFGEDFFGDAFFGDDFFGEDFFTGDFGDDFFAGDFGDDFFIGDFGDDFFGDFGDDDTATVLFASSVVDEGDLGPRENRVLLVLTFRIPSLTALLISRLINPMSMGPFDWDWISLAIDVAVLPFFSCNCEMAFVISSR